MKDFENQFEKKTTLKTEGGDVHVFDIQPQNIQNPHPVFISSGWASTPELLKPLLKTIYKNNRRVVTIDFKDLDKKIKNQNREILKAKAIINTINHLDLDKIDIIGHSEGAVNTTYATDLDCEKFRKIVLVAPAGIIKKESFINLIIRFILDTFSWPIKKIRGTNRPLYQIPQNLKFILLNPIQSMSEGYELSKIHIDDKVIEIIKLGVPTNLIYFEDDLLFPKKYMEKVIREKNIPSQLLQGTHNCIYHKPEIIWDEIKNFF